MELTCSACGADHLYAFVYCQQCEAVMNELRPYQGPTLQVPIHLKRANEGGYTQASIRRENDEGKRQMEATGQI